MARIIQLSEPKKCPDIPDKGKFEEIAIRLLDEFEKNIGPLHERDLKSTDKITVKKKYYDSVGKKLQKRVEDLQGFWGTSPCSLGGAKMQEMASCLHKNERRQTCEIIPDKRYEKVESDLMQAILAEEVFTQEFLKRKYNSQTITAYRGIYGIKPDACINLPVRPLSSWTIDKDRAAMIVVRAVRGKVPMVIVKKEIPIDRIVAFSPISEFLLEAEQELIVLSEDSTERICPENIEEVKPTF